MSAWHEEIREEGVKWACFAEGGVRDPRMEHFMAASRQEGRDWVDAAYIRKTTPKVKKPVEPAQMESGVFEIVRGEGFAFGDGEPKATMVEVAADRVYVSEPATAPVGEINALLAPEAPETATGDQAGSVEAPAPRQKRQYRKRQV